MKYKTITLGTLAALMLFSGISSMKGQIPTAEDTAADSTILLPYYLLSQQDDNGQLGAPLPFNPYPNLTVTPLDNGRGYAVDDLDVAVAQSLLSVTAMSSSEPPGLPPDGETDTNYYSGTTTRYNIFGSNGIWLELGLDEVNPGWVIPILHNATNGYWELFKKANLNSPTQIANWTPVDIQEADPATNAISFNNLQMIDTYFFRAVGGNTKVSINKWRYSPDPVEPCTSSPEDKGTLGIFEVQ